MTIREFIEQLNRLDRDSRIWIEYDAFMLVGPDIDIVTKEDEARHCADNIKSGDYVIRVG